MFGGISAILFSLVMHKSAYFRRITFIFTFVSGVGALFVLVPIIGVILLFILATIGGVIASIMIGVDLLRQSKPVFAEN